MWFSKFTQKFSHFNRNPRNWKFHPRVKDFPRQILNWIDNRKWTFVPAKFHSKFAITVTFSHVVFSDIAGITFVTFFANVLTVICALPLLTLPFFAKFNLCANFAISVLTLLTELFVYFFSFNFCTMFSEVLVSTVELPVITFLALSSALRYWCNYDRSIVLRVLDCCAVPSKIDCLAHYQTNSITIYCL